MTVLSVCERLCLCRPGARAGEGEASAGVAAGGTEGSERGAGGWAADDGGRQAEAGGQHAGSAHTVRARHPGKTARSLERVGT